MQDTRSLPAELTIYTIGELYPQCLAWAEAPADEARSLSVQAHAVAEVDAAGVQLLLSLSNTLLAHDRQLQLLNPSEPLAQACLALGAASLVDQADVKGRAQ